MIKIGILLLVLVTLSTSVSFKQFNEALNTCDNNITTCKFNFYDSPAVGDEEIECAQDIQKARVCLANYKQCFPANSTDADMLVEVDVC